MPDRVVRASQPGLAAYARPDGGRVVLEEEAMKRPRRRSVEGWAMGMPPEKTPFLVYNNPWTSGMVHVRVTVIGGKRV